MSPMWDKQPNEQLKIELLSQWKLSLAIPTLTTPCLKQVAYLSVK